MLKLKQIVKFSICAFCVDEVLEGVDYFFDGEYFLGFLMLGLVDDAIGALPHPLQNLKLAVDLIF